MSVTTELSKLASNRFLVGLGTFATELHFGTGSELTFTIVEGAGLTDNGYSENVSFKAVTIRPDLYFIGWKEKSGATVSHIEDHSTEVLHSVITMPDGQFLHLTGTIQPSGGPKADKKVPSVLVNGLTGKKIESDFGNFKVQLHFKSEDELHILPISGIALEQPGQNVKLHVIQIFPDVYLATWKESNGITVAEVLDFENGKVYSNLTLTDKTFLNIEGTTSVLL